MIAEAVKKISVKMEMLKNTHTFVRVKINENFSSKVSSFRITNRNLVFSLLLGVVLIFLAICQPFSFAWKSVNPSFR
jgi:hypothetical protein